MLGLINEIDELLREIGWKRHRGNVSILRQASKQNLAYELADLTKYVLSLWQIWGFDLDTMLLEIARKNTIMKVRLQQEFAELPKAGTKVLLTDMDGTLANLRYGLWEYGMSQGIVDPVEHPYKISTLNYDVDFGIDYRTFQKLKQRFIEGHGFATLRPMEAACKAVRKALNDGVYVIAYTARPADKYPRLWLESWCWLEDQNLNVAGLYIGDDVRINLILELAERGCDVVLFDDDPDTIERALNSGLKVVVPKYPYNAKWWKDDNARAVDVRNGHISFPFSTESAKSTNDQKTTAVS